MAILDFSGNSGNAQQTSNRNTGRMMFGGMTDPNHNGDKPKSKIWLNVGYDANGKFITLPLGQGIDTMNAADVRGQNEDFVKQRNAQNELLKMLQQLGASMQPGEEKELNLKVKIRRVNEQLEIAREDNEYSFDPTALVAAAPIQVAAE